MYDNEKTPSEMIRILPDDSFNEAMCFINLGDKLDCKASTRYAHANKYWRCVYSRKKPVRVLFTVECTEEWWRIKACLLNIDKYRDSLTSCSENIRNTIINAYDCKSCNDHCKGGAKFTFEEKQYQKCTGVNFYFSGLEEEEHDDLILLLTKEHEAAGFAK
jgi:hypothetical protein